MRKVILAALAAALALGTAPVAQAYTDEELNFISNLVGNDITNRNGPDGMVDLGWTICTALAQGHSRFTVARELFLSSREANGVAGVDYPHAQAIVYYAEADLCPGV